MRRYRSNRWLPICRRLALGLSLVIAAPAAAVQFSIVVIPDTQYLSQCHPAVFQAQTQWIVDNRVARNIVYVAQLGDLTQDYGDAASEWANAVSALSLLENPVTTGLTEGIPYGVLPGNHDVDGTPGINATGNSPNYNVNFGPTRFSGRAYYQGSQNAATNDNNYTFFSAGGIDFMAINLAYANNYVSNNNCADPGSNEEAVLCWADGLLTANSTRKAIITSHHILDNDGTFGPYGQAMWNRFQDNANLYLMLSAHMHTGGQAEAWRKKSRTGGMGDVHILMSNYQDYDYSGTSSPPACSGTSGDNRDSGYMRVLTFDSVHDDIAVETISPWILADNSLPTSSPGGACVTPNFAACADDASASCWSGAAGSASNFAIDYDGIANIFPGVSVLLDTSGSMSWDVEGVPGVLPSERRIKFARDAAGVFVDLLNTSHSNDADFGIANFPNPSATCNGGVITGMTRITNTSANTAVTSTIPGLSPSGGTPMLAGVDTARSMFSDQWCRAVVLLTDGYHNCPTTVSTGDAAVETVVDALNNENTRAFTISFGKKSTNDYDLLEHLADRTTPRSYGGSQFKDATEPSFNPATWNPATALAIAFDKILGDLLALQPARDPPGVIAAGETQSHEVRINEHDRRVNFVLAWRTSQTGRLTLTVRDSSGNIVKPIAGHGAGLQRPTYTIQSFDQQQLAAPGRVGPTPWTIEIATEGMKPGETEPFMYSVMMDSGLRMEPELAGRNAAVGDTITLTARLTEAGRPILGLDTVEDKVEVEIDAPGDGRGNWLSTNAVSANQLARVPEAISGESLAPFQRKAIYLTDIGGIEYPGRLTPRTLRLYDDATHSDAVAGDGIYTNTYSDTGKEGIYSFYFRARGPTTGANTFDREQMVQKYLSVRAVPDSILVAATVLTMDDVQRYAVRVTPQDALGNYLGPGHAGLLTLTPTVGSFIGSLVDNLDGSYTQVLTVSAGTAEKDVDIDVQVGETVKEVNLGDAVDGRGIRPSFHLGATFPHGTFGNNYDTGLNLGLDLEYKLNLSWSAVGALEFNRFQGGSTGVTDAELWSLTGGLKHYLRPGSVRPYLAGGVGLYDPDFGSTESGIHFGVGVDRELSARWTLELGVDYHNVFVSGGDDIEYSVARVGLLWRP